MKKQKENSHEGITWSEMGKQNVQAEKVYYLCNKFICRGDVSERNTRNSQLLNIPLFKTTTGQRSFSYRVVDIWNNLPTDIKLCKNVAGFKIKLRKYLLNEFLVS